jgi:hypothetical protein
MRTILGKGVFGEIVTQVQQTLTAAGYSTQGVDGQYGGNTAQAVAAFQTAQGVGSTGTVDDGTWTALMNAALPAVAERSLQLTASIEGQGFTLAVGNFDGALLTWGIIGFTMKYGEVQKIILEVNAQNPQSVTNAFQDQAPAILAIMQDTPANQLQWANQNTVKGGGLAEPLKSMFAAFGSDPVVQAVQLAHVQSEYTLPAIQTAKSYGLESELGLALCFDCHVQNGGITAAAAAKIGAQNQPGTAEGDLLKIIATAVAGSANPKWQADVLSRKMMIATGAGLVHGTQYVLDNWGLGLAYAAQELT